MKGVKKGLTNMKDVFQRKGMISDTNIQKLDLEANNGENNMNVSSKSINNNSQKTTKTAANSNSTTSSTRNNNTRNNELEIIILEITIPRIMKIQIIT